VIQNLRGCADDWGLELPEPLCDSAAR